MQIKPYIFRPHTLIFFHNSSTRKQAFYLELNNQLIQLRVYNKSKAGHFYLSRLLQHSLKLQNANADFFDIAFRLITPDQFRLSVNQHEVHSHIEDIPPESKTDHSMGSFSNEHEIYIGGHLTLTLGNPFPIVSAAENSLIGCVGDVNINGHLCDPRQSSFVGDATGGFGVVDCARNVCTQHACEGSSFCKPVSSTEYACQCPIGTRPPWCKQDRIPVIPEFLGNSYLSVRGFRATSWTETLLEMTFLPKKTTGLIIYSGFSFDKRGDFICVALVNGKIIVSLDLGHGPSFKKSAQNLTLNSWHTLRVKRRGRSFDIYLSGQHTSSGPEIFTQGSFVQLTIMDELYVGGIPNPDRISAYLPEYQELVSYKSVRGFSGCVQSLIINGLRVDLVEDFIEFVNIVNCEMHECAQRFPPCGFNGKCIALSHTWKCICKAGLGGPKCEKNLLRAFNSRIAFDAYSFLAIEQPKSILPKLTPTLKISANISKSKHMGSSDWVATGSANRLVLRKLSVEFLKY
ncbi:Pikachurin [Echinococcus granulosus]|nr:Pikachurin [Echinococcus granulosus]